MKYSWPTKLFAPLVYRIVEEHPCIHGFEIIEMVKDRGLRGSAARYSIQALLSVGMIAQVENIGFFMEASYRVSPIIGNTEVV
jgi:hypothetical protein